MNRLQDQTLDSTDVVLNDKEQIFLGPRLVLKSCRVLLSTSASGLTVVQAELDSCTIEAKRKLANFQGWCRVAIKNCIFRGKFTGNDFGHWPEVGVGGSIADCDFTNAILNGCRFIDCDMTSIQLPQWPCFTILNPHQRQRELEELDWPGTLLSWAQGLLWSPPTTVAEVNLAPEISKKFQCSEAELREALDRLGGVVL